jgi:hypothetical protein
MATELPIDEASKSAGAALTASPERADEIFLEGPRPRFEEFITLLRVMHDFLRGFRILHFVGPCVTVFGSSRLRRRLVEFHFIVHFLNKRPLLF